MRCPICRACVDRDDICVYDDRYAYPGEFQVLRCRSCDHRFLGGDFSPELLKDLYSNYYPRSTFDVEQHRAHEETSGFKSWFDGDFSTAFRWVPKNVRVLDIGCGFGESVGYHKSRGCDVYGVRCIAALAILLQRLQRSGQQPGRQRPHDLEGLFPASGDAHQCRDC